MVNLRELWEKWKLEILVLGSLTLQVILFLIGSSRKRSSGKLIISLLWVTYLSADWVATFSLGTISSTLSCSTPSYARIDIMTLWAPFLLLHLGGPDTISAFSLEDNQLWLRHAMTLLLQTIAAVHIFIISIPRAKFISPAAFIFLAGILKYGERTWALKRSSLKALRGLSTRILEDILESTKELENDHLLLLHLAYYCFIVFRKLFLDQILSSEEAGQLVPIFKESGPSDAFQVLEIELSLAYDILYTKALVVHSRSGCLLRAACFISEFIAFFLFLATEKKDYQKADVAITYILLTAALALEIIALASLIFSDWTIVELVGDDFRKNRALKRSFREVLLEVSRPPSQEHRRWSNRIGQYNLLGYCIKNRRPIAWFDKLLKSFGMKEMWNEVRYTEFVQIKDGLKEFIFNHLKDEANLIGTSSEQRGDFSRNRGGRALERRNCFQLSWSTRGAFDESLLVWHIATDICFHFDEARSKRPDFERRELSKNLSGYLLYLLLVHPLAMSSTSGLPAYEDTCQKAMDLFKIIYDGDESEAVRSLMSSVLRSCERDERGDPVDVLPKAAKLATELLKLPEREMDMWKIVSEVLLEMLCFAARRCKGNYHAQMLSYGGELLTFMWFLEAHLGLVELLLVEDNFLRTDATHE